MLELTTDEARVLGVLIEKALTTPNQYPLSLNAVTDGCNQKNNRDPVVNFEEDQVFSALESLRAKGIVARVDQMGARVTKFKHLTGEKLSMRTGEVAVLGELLLRGPQTLGELRGRASRMAPMETLETARDLVRALMERPEPYVKQLPPEPGSRAEKYAQLFSPLPEGMTAASSEPSTIARSASSTSSDLEKRVEQLESETAALRAAITTLAKKLGEADPFASNVVENVP